jgi:hypothetical protein
MKYYILIATLLFFNRSYGNDLEKSLDDYAIGDTSGIFNKYTLNYLINSEINPYYAISSAPPIKGQSVALNNDDNSLSLGYSFNFKPKNESLYLSYLMYLGFKVKTNPNENFYQIFDGTEANNNIGVDFRFNYFVPGKVFFENDGFVDERIKDYRNKIIMVLLKKQMELNEKMTEEEIINFIAKKEVKYIRTNESYEAMDKIWFGMNIYYPIVSNDYELSDSEIIPNSITKSFQDYNFGLNFNYMYNNLKCFSMLFSINYNFLNNNNILLDDSKKIRYIQENRINDSIFAVKEYNFYDTDYFEFFTHRIEFEFTSLFLLDKTLGISAAYQLNIDEFSNNSWRLGLPFSFKDSDGKRTVNFEIQWKEVNKNHFIGISVGHAIGNFIN